MKQTFAPRALDNGSVEPAHEVQVFCDACGYDLDAAEVAAAACADCGAPLNLQQHVAIQVTTMPSLAGSTL